jgi:hypothetical protein
MNFSKLRREEMKRIRIPFLVITLSLMAGMAFALDIPNISTWTQSTGVGGGGPGRGDVLIGALYDVRNLQDPNLSAPFNTEVQAQQTLISIVNTDNDFGVIARLRFREWKRSHECLDIDIPLTTNDVWVAEVSRLAAGGPVLNSPDRWINNIPNPLTTGTFTAALISATDFGLGVGNGIPFRGNQILQFEPSLSPAQAMERCEYGYWEVIGEEKFSVINKAVNPWIISRIPAFPCTAGVSFQCRDVHDTLMGNAYIIRPDQAISHQYNANALSDFAVDSNGIWASPLTDLPNLRDDVQGEVVPTRLAPNVGVGGINQLEAVLSKRFVLYQYVNSVKAADGTVIGGTPMTTSVVVTMPTKWFHFTNTPPSFLNIGPATWPFGTPFVASCEVTGDGPGGSCPGVNGGGEIVNVKVFDRDENTFIPRDQNPISPPDILTPGLPRLPFEVNVIGIDPHDPAPIVFRNNVAIATANSQTGQTFTAGWGWIDLSPNLRFVSTDPRAVTQGESGIIFNWFGNMFPLGPIVPPLNGQFPGAYRGLPAIGIVMTEFFNDTVEGYFGNTVPWQYSVDFGSVPCTDLTGITCGSSVPPNGTITGGF